MSVSTITIPVKVLEKVTEQVKNCCYLKTCPNNCGHSIIHRLEWLLEHGIRGRGSEEEKDE